MSIGTLDHVSLTAVFRGCFGRLLTMTLEYHCVCRSTRGQMLTVSQLLRNNAVQQLDNLPCTCRGSQSACREACSTWFDFEKRS